MHINGGRLSVSFQQKVLKSLIPKNSWESAKPTVAWDFKIDHQLKNKRKHSLMPDSEYKRFNSEKFKMHTEVCSSSHISSSLFSLSLPFFKLRPFSKVKHLLFHPGSDEWTITLFLLSRMGGASMLGKSGPLEQRSAHHGLSHKSGPLPAFTNKVLLENSYSQLFTYWLVLCNNDRAEQ